MGSLNLKLAAAFSIATFALLAGGSASAAQPEQFTLKFTAKLAKLTQDLKHPGGVNFEYSPDSKEEIITLSLDECQDWGGATHCSKMRKKNLVFEDVTFSYWVNVYNESNSKKHTVVLLICTGRDAATSCSKNITTQVTFDGTSIPEIELYNSGLSNHEPGEPATYQPTLTIGNAP